MTTTGGTGGPLTDRTGVAYLASNGYDSFSHIYAAGIDTSKPIGLFVWLHGDGAYEYLNPTSTLYLAGPNGIVAAAKERNCIVLVPLTPDNGTANGRTWWKWGSGNARYLRELIVSEIYGKYNIDLGKIWIAGFSGGAETTTAIFLPTQANNLQIEGGGFMPFGGGPRPSWYSISEAWTPNFDPAVFHGYWIVGENDTAENATDGYDAVLAAQAGYDWYGTKGFPTDIYYVPGKTHILSPEWGNLMRAAWVKYDSAGGSSQSGMYIGSQQVIGVYVGSTPVKAVYVGSQKIWPTTEVVRITLGTGLQARDQLRAALSARGLNYTTVTEIPFNIELVGTGVTQSMFANCVALTSVPAMDTSSVTNMSGMFQGCSSLTSVPDMDTAQVTNMGYMFYNCASLTDGNVRLIGKHPSVDTDGMIEASGLTREPFYDAVGNPI